jgi:hypothetical protein
MYKDKYDTLPFDKPTKTIRIIIDESFIFF